MLITCASSTETELAFVGDLAFLLGASASSSGMIQPLAAASREAERHILNDPNGVIRRQIYQETVAGHGSPRLMLSRTPVLGVQRLFDGTDTGTATEYCSTDYRIEDAEAGFLTLTGVSLFARDWIWGQDIQVYPVPNAEVAADEQLVDVHGLDDYGADLAGRHPARRACACRRAL